VFVPCDVVRQAAVAVADHEGLAAEDWLKDAVKGFLPGPDPDAQRFYSSDSLIVYVAFPCFMVAMKVLAAGCEDRRRRHRSALPATRLTTVDEGPDLAGQAYPGRPVPARFGSCLPRWTLQQQASVVKIK
jgi:hypothetical protein